MDLPHVRRTFVDGPYGQLHCRLAIPEEARAAPVVCLHMSPKSGRSYHEVLPHLADGRIAMAPDYPGHGESDLPPAEPHVSVEDFAACTWKVIDAIGGGPVHLLGYHTGSMVAVECASQRPGDVISVINISAPVFTEEEQAALSGEYAPIPIDEAGTRFRIMWERVLQHRGPGMTLQMAASSFAENLRAGDNYEWGHRAAFDYAATYNRRLAEIEHPVLVLNPADDCHEQTLRADGIMKNGQRVECPHWGHGFLNAYPADAARVILDFIDRTERNA
ncbi:MAG: alpha/beta hydrolase [Woeseiaceae bacterium]|nr:alpha/beta hydrolase [Woeseiaceae bacterium]